MLDNEFRSMILDLTPNKIYFIDLETYELLFINSLLKKDLNINDDKEYEGQKCYKLLHGRNTPCEFCTNDKLSFNSFYVWYHYNDYLGRYFKISDRLVQLKDGRLARLEIATDITEEETQKRQLGIQAESHSTLVNCIQTLTEIADQKRAINRLLSLIGNFYNGNRAYIFEFNQEKGTISNTYEWCKEGISKEIDNLQEIDISIIDNWMIEFNKNGSFYLSSVGRNLDKNSLEYQILNEQNIESLIAAPLIENNEIVGFIGVDDPTKNTLHLNLLTSVTYFVINDIQKRKMMTKLEKLSFMDLLTEIYNRNKYIHDIEKLENQEIKQMGVIFVDINGLKKLNDEQGHEAGDNVIKLIAQTLNDYFPNQSYRIGGDEFVSLAIDIDKDYFYHKLELLSKTIESQKDVSASIGAIWDNKKISISELIDKADKIMYDRKRVYHENLKIKVK